MGLFSWIQDKFEDVKDAVVSGIETAVDAVKDFFGLGRSASYTGTVLQVVNVEKVLNAFKNDLNEKIKVQEETCIRSAFMLFNELIEELKDDFYDSIIEAKQKRDQSIQSLRGLMTNYAEKRISENDPQFETILKMQPGSAKEEQLKKRTVEIVTGAETAFYEQLKKEIESLNDDLAKSLEENLAEQGNQITAEKEQLEELEQSASNGTLDLKALEMSVEPTIETADYLLLLLSKDT